VKLTHEHLIVARQFGFEGEHLIHEIIQAFDKHPIVILVQLDEVEARMVVSLRHCTLIKEACELFGKGASKLFRHHSR
jgi:hypothetical protein